MKPEMYTQFIEQLTHNLEADRRVWGLVACGSMAGTQHQPDEWSDHDFMVIVEPGAAEDFRNHLAWLPDAGEIVLVFRETQHAVKVVYPSGHLLEAAVFEPDEFPIVSLNAYRVLLDRADIAVEAARIQTQTTQRVQNGQHDDRHRFGQTLTNLLVGAGRYARGEKLSGHTFIKYYALGNLLPLLVKYGDTERRDIVDNLDVMRRFEFAFPAWGAELNAILLLEPPEAARQLLDLADRLLRDHLHDYPAAAVETIRRYLSDLPR